MGDARDRVLCVDNEAMLLSALARVLSSRYELTMADGPERALELIQSQAPFAVIVSDFEMPGMNGAELLRRVKERSPRTVRVLLSGRANVQDVARSVNEGQIFRFLLKPLTVNMVAEVVAQAVEHHHVLVAEQNLFEETLTGCVAALLELLTISQPAAFGRALRLRRHVADLSRITQNTQLPHVESAALLSQVGCISLLPETAAKLYHKQALTPAESDAVRRLPAVTETVLAHIPRMDVVRQIIQDHSLRYDGSHNPPGRPSGSSISLGARMLRIAVDFDALIAEGCTGEAAIAAMERDSGPYDPDFLAAFRGIRTGNADFTVIHQMPLGTVREGMVFAADLIGPAGILLVARGQVVTPNLKERIHELWSDLHHSTVRMVVPAP